jgi:cation transport protein ChaC
VTRREDLWFEKGLRREDITEERFATITAEAARIGGFKTLDFEAREASRRAVLAQTEPGEDLWVFGYGSLMWNPAFYCQERRAGRIYGYHRSFCLWTPLGRGSPDCPGLVLGLDRGGSCHGVALRIAAHEVESETQIIWRREMISGTYEPRWVTVNSKSGRLRAIAFVIDPTHPRYGRKLALETTVHAIAMAEGRLGRCSDYLFSTVRHLDELGIGDGPMHRLRDLVKARQRAH